MMEIALPPIYNHGSGKWLYLKGNDYWRGPFCTSMIMGGRVIKLFEIGICVTIKYLAQQRKKQIL